MASDDSQFHFVVDPGRNPYDSTAFEGYLWKVQVNDEEVYITDLDELAEAEADRGRDVSILDIEGASPSPSTQQWVESFEK